MLFQKRISRAFRHQSDEADQRREKTGDQPLQDPETPPLSDLMEKNDMLAMILSALLLIVPIALVVLLLMVLVGRLVLRV